MSIGLQPCMCLANGPSAALVPVLIEAFTVTAQAPACMPGYTDDVRAVRAAARGLQLTASALVVDALSCASACAVDTSLGQLDHAAREYSWSTLQATNNTSRSWSLTCSRPISSSTARRRSLPASRRQGHIAACIQVIDLDRRG
jgi:hypothetical protein